MNFLKSFLRQCDGLLHSKYIQWLGRLIVLASLFFVGLKLWQYKDEFQSIEYDPKLGIYFLIVTVFYGSIKFIHAYGWFQLLQMRKNHKLSLSVAQSIIVFGKTHIAKYIPGNIFHYTSRHFLTKKYGLSHSFLLKTTFIEIFIVSSIALFFSLFTVEKLFLAIDRYAANFGHSLWVYSFLIFIFLGIAVFLLRKYLAKQFSNIDLIELIKTYFFYGLFFVISFCVFLVIVIYFTDDIRLYSDIFFLFGCYSIAWLLGFLIPGAPGGIGVREAVLITLLSDRIPVTYLLLSIISFRVITITGELLHFVLTLVFEKIMVSKQVGDQ